MRRQFSNSIYGLLDYAAYPIGMLCVAPFILRNLGTTQYGIWAVTLSIVNIGSILASGFGDANTQKIAFHRGNECEDEVLRVVRASMGVHLLLGGTSALAIWCLAGVLGDRLALHDSALRTTCVGCIRIAAVLTAIRAIETVCISTQKAYERYGAAVRLSVAWRLLSLAAAAILASHAQGVQTIIIVTVAVAVPGVGVQLIELRRLLRGQSIAPTYEHRTSQDLLHFGAFTWIIGAAGVAFSQADRLAGGASVGAAGVVSYTLCAQLSQPLFGLTAAGLHFLFPYIASRRESLNGSALRKTLLLAVLANVGFVFTATGLLLHFSGLLLHLLASEELANASRLLLPSVLFSSTLLALSVAGSYALVAVGRVRTVALLNVLGCVAFAVVTTSLFQSLGLKAIISGRIAFALIVLGVYIPLSKEFCWPGPVDERFASMEAGEEA